MCISHKLDSSPPRLIYPYTHFTRTRNAHSCKYSFTACAAFSSCCFYVCVHVRDCACVSAYTIICFWAAEMNNTTRGVWGMIIQPSCTDMHFHPPQAAIRQLDTYLDLLGVLALLCFLCRACACCPSRCWGTGAPLPLLLLLLLASEGCRRVGLLLLRLGLFVFL